MLTSALKSIYCFPGVYKIKNLIEKRMLVVKHQLILIKDVCLSLNTLELNMY